MFPAPPDPSGNQLLSRMPAAEYGRLAGAVELVRLDYKRVLYESRAAIGHVYFPLGAVVSALIRMGDAGAVEVATVGREGVVGVGCFFGATSSPHEMLVQYPGPALRLGAAAFQAEAARGGALHEALTRYQTAFTMQVSYAVACNALHGVEARCCRWLLMMSDRAGTPDIPLTHELLSIMLGVRRATITDVLRPLEAKGLMTRRRGLVSIADRPGAEAVACPCYRNIADEFALLM